MYVIATAGHVDHGKSTLVRALTGMEPDRFAEEQRRGLTIELGYVWTTTPAGHQLAFVDVPGHERFIGTMLAGLGPSPAVLFVVAADEGWSRQSDEHLAAIDALGVTHGLLAVTRSDLADPAPTLADARARLAHSSLGAVEAVAVSGATGEGLDELRDALDRLVADLPAPDTTAPVRLWLDRSFSVTGAGTVVTGTLAAGRLAIGDTLRAGNTDVVVRGLQTAGDQQHEVSAVARVAVNLRGASVGALARGDALLTPGAWWHTELVDARVDTDDELAAHLVLHLGTAAVPARLRPLGGRTYRVTLARPLPLRAGDRAVLRDPGRHAVAAGVVVLDADPPPLTRRGAARRRAAELAGATGTPVLADEMARRGVADRGHLERLGVPLADLGDVRQVGNHLVDPATWQAWRGGVADALTRWAAEHPLDPDPPLRAFARLLGLPDADPRLAEALVREAGRAVRDGRVAAASGGPALPKAAAELARRLDEHPFTAPEADELTAAGLGRRELAAAERAGALLQVAPGIVLAPDAPERAVQVLSGLDEPFTLSAARQALGTTRRVAVPLLEYLDRQGATRRVDGSLRSLVRRER